MHCLRISIAVYHSTGSVSSTATNSGVGGYQGAQNKMAPTADVMTYPAHATPSYSIGQGYTITLPGTQFEPVITVPYPGPIPNISSGPAIRLPALPRPDGMILIMQLLSVHCVPDLHHATFVNNTGVNLTT